jgi:putative ABC transport system permease protein
MMLRHYLVAALRNLVRNKLYAGINIVGLAVGFAAAILIALYVRHEVSYDDWLPNSDRTYVLIESWTHTSGAVQKFRQTPDDLPAKMALDLPMIQSLTRMVRNKQPIRHGDTEAIEGGVFWADPNVFTVLQLPVLYGDLSTALDQPDSIVITRQMARKYFGKDNPIGETLELNRTTVLKVTAVLQDLPSNTNLDAEFIASGRNAVSFLTDFDTHPGCSSCLFANTEVYLRLKPGATVDELKNAMPAFLDRHKHAAMALHEAQGERFAYEFTQLRQLHTRSDIAGYTKPAADPATLSAMAGIGFLIVLAASINFINLMTARAARRATEVGIRKVAGADRRDLIAQFVGESVVYVALGVVLAMALVELLLPHLNAVMNVAIAFDWWRQRLLIAIMAGLILSIGLLAGFYPAFVMASFKPASVLKDGGLPPSGAVPLRQALVIVQFAILIGLIVATLVVTRQTDYALSNGMRMNMDQMLFLNVYGSASPDESTCKPAFKDAVARLPGVRAAACSDGWTTGFQDSWLGVITTKGSKITAADFSVGFGFLELYGMKPIAGRFFSQEHPSDAVWRDDKGETAFQAPIVINETAVKALGFLSAADAIGKSVTIEEGKPQKQPSEIVGVAPDVAVDAIHTVIMPQIYYVNLNYLYVLHVKLNGHDAPETLESIDRLWTQLGSPRALRRIFLNEFMQQYYLVDIIRQSQLFAAFSGVALFIAGLGLFGLSAFTAERRTKEIGIRKAMGASRLDIMKLLLWQFAKPVLYANLIAWPVAYYFMNRWLHGFAAHVELQVWIFVAAMGIALTIALATISVHAFRVAAARPVMALRYE